jgi:hypothetical protein
MGSVGKVTLVMGTPPITVYANVVNVKITGNELIFEFGAQFPNTTSPTSAGKPVEFVPEVRIVLGKSALKTFADILQKASAQSEGASSNPRQSDPQGSTSTSKQ